MKVAIIGSRRMSVIDLENYIPEDTTEIVSGGDKGIGSCAREYAKNNRITLTEFFPRYDVYGTYAPLKRNLKIIDYADKVIVFWDGKSKGTKFVIDNCKKFGKIIDIINMEKKN